MLEATTNPAAATAIERAHAERGKASREFWGWVFAGFSR